MKKLDIKYELKKIWIVLKRHTKELEELRAEKKGDGGKG